MKKILSVWAIVLATLCFVSCEKKEADEPKPQDPQEQQDPQEDPQESLEGVTVIGRVQVQRIGANCIAYMLYDDESGKAFVYPIYIAEAAEDVELGKTYTFPDDMNTVYAYWMLSDYTTHSLYSAATFKKTEVGEDKIRIDATATDMNADSWALLYDETME